MSCSFNGVVYCRVGGLWPSGVICLVCIQVISGLVSSYVGTVCCCVDLSVSSRVFSIAQGGRLSSDVISGTSPSCSSSSESLSSSAGQALFCQYVSSQDALELGGRTLMLDCER